MQKVNTPQDWSKMIWTCLVRTFHLFPELSGHNSAIQVGLFIVTLREFENWTSPKYLQRNYNNRRQKCDRSFQANTNLE